MITFASLAACSPVGPSGSAGGKTGIAPNEELTWLAFPGQNDSDEPTPSVSLKAVQTQDSKVLELQLDDALRERFAQRLMAGFTEASQKDFGNSITVELVGDCGEPQLGGAPSPYATYVLKLSYDYKTVRDIVAAEWGPQLYNYLHRIYEQGWSDDPESEPFAEAWWVAFQNDEESLEQWSEHVLAFAKQTAATRRDDASRSQKDFLAFLHSRGTSLHALVQTRANDQAGELRGELRAFNLSSTRKPTELGPIAALLAPMPSLATVSTQGNQNVWDLKVLEQQALKEFLPTLESWELGEWNTSSNSPVDAKNDAEALCGNYRAIASYLHAQQAPKESGWGFDPGALFSNPAEADDASTSINKDLREESLSEMNIKPEGPRSTTVCDLLWHRGATQPEHIEISDPQLKALLQSHPVTNRCETHEDGDVNARAYNEAGTFSTVVVRPDIDSDDVWNAFIACGDGLEWGKNFDSVEIQNKQTAVMYYAETGPSDEGIWTFTHLGGDAEITANPTFGSSSLLRKHYGDEKFRTPLPCKVKELGVAERSK